MERKSIFGKKLCMTKYFDNDGSAIPVTAIHAGPCTVVQIKTKKHDGYDAIQVGFDPHTRKKGLNGPLTSHFKQAGVPPMRQLRDIRLGIGDEYKPGDVLRAALFEVGEKVDITATSKGRGFAGGVKRHGWGGGRATHGSMFHRGPGSIGQSSYPSRVIRGKRLPGRMGSNRVTIQGLRVISIDTENDLLYVKGSVPGANGGYVLVRESVKQTPLKLHQ